MYYQAIYAEVREYAGIADVCKQLIAHKNAYT